MRKLAVAALCAGLLPAASLHRLRGVALPNSEIRALSFSPDAQSLAVVATRSGGWFDRASQLLTLPRDAGTPRLLAPLDAPIPGPRAFPQLSWSPAGDAIAVGADPPLIVHTSGGRSCALPRTARGAVLLGGFLSAGTVVTAEPGSPSRLVLSNLDCQPQLHVEMPGRIVSVDADAVSGRIALAFEDGALAVWDGRAGRELQRWPGPRAAGSVKLLAGGGAVCEAFTPAENRNHPRCRAVAAHSPASEPDAWGGLPFAVSSQAPLALFTDGKYSYDAFWEEARIRQRGLLLWDESAAAPVLKLPARAQHCDSILPSESDCPKPWIFALSADGRFLAEGGNGRVEIFEIRR